MANFDNRRKDSTSTIGARLSFSSDAPTRSTCSSMISSGFHSGYSTDLLKPPRFSYSEEDEQDEERRKLKYEDDVLENDDDEDEEEEEDDEDDEEEYEDDDCDHEFCTDSNVWNEDKEKELFLNESQLESLKVKSVPLNHNKLPVVNCFDSTSVRALLLNFPYDITETWQNYIKECKHENIPESSKKNNKNLSLDMLQYLLFIFVSDQSEENREHNLNFKQLNIYGLFTEQSQLSSSSSSSSSSSFASSKAVSKMLKESDKETNREQNVPIECIDCLHHFLIDQLFTTLTTPQEEEEEEEEMKMLCNDKTFLLCDYKPETENEKTLSELKNKTTIGLLHCSIVCERFIIENGSQINGLHERKKRKKKRSKILKKRKKKEMFRGAEEFRVGRPEASQTIPTNIPISLHKSSASNALSPTDKLKKSPLHNRLLSNSHERIRSFIQTSKNFLTGSSNGNRQGHHRTAISGNKVDNDVQHHHRTKQLHHHHHHRQQQQKQRCQWTGDVRRRSSSAFVLSDFIKHNGDDHKKDHTDKNHQNPDHRTASSCTQLQHIKSIDRPESRSSSSFVNTEPEVERCRSVISDSGTSGSSIPKNQPRSCEWIT